MKHFIAALSLTAILVPAPAFAQDAAALVDSCQRAWTNSDWTTVAADCSTVAQLHENTGEAHILELQMTGNPQVERDVNGMIGRELLIAGEAWTRAAVGYYRLGNTKSFEHNREVAVEDLKRAEPFASAEVKRQAAALLDFIPSGPFLATAPDSPLLAHLSIPSPP